MAEGVKTHASLDEIVPLNTDVLAFWRGTVGAENVGWAGAAKFHRITRGDRNGYDLVNGAGTLTITKAVVDIFGNPTSSFALTMPDPPDPTALNQKIELVTSGTWGGNIITLQDAVTPTPQVIKVLMPDVIYELRWRGTGANPRWNVEGWKPRQLTTSSDYVGGDGVLRAISTFGAMFDPLDDAGNYSEIPDPGTNPAFTVGSDINVNRFFTGAQDQVIQFPDDLSTNPAAYGFFTAPPANTLKLRRVSGSTVSINGVAADGTIVWIVPPGGTVYWQVRAANTIQLWGDGRPILLQEEAEPASPAAGLVALYVDSADGVLKVKKSNGTVVSLEVQ